MRMRRRPAGSSRGRRRLRRSRAQHAGCGRHMVLGHSLKTLRHTPEWATRARDWQKKGRAAVWGVWGDAARLGPGGVQSKAKNLWHIASMADACCVGHQAFNPIRGGILLFLADAFPESNRPSESLRGADARAQASGKSNRIEGIAGLSGSNQAVQLRSVGAGQ